MDLYTWIFFVCLVFIAGCTGKEINKNLLQQIDSTAVPIVYFYEHINLDPLQNDDLVEQDMSKDGIGGQMGKLDTIRNFEGFDLRPELNLIHARIFDGSSDVLPMDILPEERVVNTPQYQNFTIRTEQLADHSIIAPDGYKRYLLGPERRSLTGNLSKVYLEQFPSRQNQSC